MQIKIRDAKYPIHIRRRDKRWIAEVKLPLAGWDTLADEVTLEACMIKVTRFLEDA